MSAMAKPLPAFVVVCRGSTCGDKRGSRQLYAAFETAARERGISERVNLSWQACFGRCSQGPNVRVDLGQPRSSLYRVDRAEGATARGPALPGRDASVVVAAPPGFGSVLYNGVRVSDVVRIIEEHVMKGKVVSDLVLLPQTLPKDPKECGT